MIAIPQSVSRDTAAAPNPLLLVDTNSVNLIYRQTKNLRSGCLAHQSDPSRYIADISCGVSFNAFASHSGIYTASVTRPVTVSGAVSALNGPHRPRWTVATHGHYGRRGATSCPKKELCLRQLPGHSSLVQSWSCFVSDSTQVALPISAILLSLSRSSSPSSPHSQRPRLRSRSAW